MFSSFKSLHIWTDTDAWLCSDGGSEWPSIAGGKSELHLTPWSASFPKSHLIVPYQNRALLQCKNMSTIRTARTSLERSDGPKPLLHMYHSFKNIKFVQKESCGIRILLTIHSLDCSDTMGFGAICLEDFSVGSFSDELSDCVVGSDWCFGDEFNHIMIEEFRIPSLNWTRLDTLTSHR